MKIYKIVIFFYLTFKQIIKRKIYYIKFIKYQYIRKYILNFLIFIYYIGNNSYDKNYQQKSYNKIVGSEKYSKPAEIIHSDGKGGIQS